MGSLSYPPIHALSLPRNGLSNSPPLRYMGSQGIYTHTVAYERDADCPICGCGVPLGIDPDMTLQQVRGTGKGSSLP